MAKAINKLKRKKKLGSYPYATVIVSITLALFVLGLFGLLILHGQMLAALVKENIEVQAYLHKDLTEAQLTRLKKTISQKQYVSQKNLTPQLEFISKEEGAKRFIAETGEDFTAFLGENPLRDALVIKVAADYAQPSQLREIKAQLEKTPGIYQVTYSESLIDSINSNLQKIGIVLFGFALILLLVSVLLINNTIKLAMFSQRFLIRSMQLVGATNRFIQFPFLKRATWHGFTAGFFSVLLLGAVLQYATLQLPELSNLQNPTHVGLLFVALILAGSILGFLSAFKAVNKYLSVSLDELY